MKCLLLLLLCTLVGCSRLTTWSMEPTSTLAGLTPVAVPAVTSVVEAIELSELEAMYAGVLQVTSDPDTRRQLQRRLADIRMLVAEEALASSDSASTLFEPAIVAYSELMLSEPSAEILYQLSKAQRLSGASAGSVATLERLVQEYPQSPHYAESLFRLAEVYFSDSRYDAAGVAYGRVVAIGESPYLHNATYMNGWARFKQGRYHPALISFIDSLDQTLPQQTELESLPRADQELVGDSLRILAVIFSYLDGHAAITELRDELGPRHYQSLLYRELGQLFLQQQRYRDSAATFLAFADENNRSPLAPDFHLLAIAALEQGDFSRDVLAAKRSYVEHFSVAGPYWLEATAATQTTMGGVLRLYLVELATHYHASAQLAAEQPEDQLKATDAVEVAAGYRLASEYYGEYVSSFPGDPREPEMQFLQAESLLEYGAVADAIAAYARVAYVFPDYPRAADAGYAAVASYELIEPETTDKQAVSVWRSARLDSEIRFAAGFPADSRVAPVLLHVAVEAFASQDYQLATIAAATLAHSSSDPQQLARANVIMADSAFNSGDFAGAEVDYARLVGLLPAGDERMLQVRERWAASIYRQAEYALRAEQPAAAAQQFERILTLVPDSSVASQAHYDAALAWLQAAEYEQSLRLLNSFRQLYPVHELSASVPARLVENYEQLAQWSAAAQELDGMAVSAQDIERQRQLQYLAATYYDRGDDDGLAIARYRSYAHAWPEPTDERFEAMNRLAELYADAGSENKRSYWLLKIVRSYDSLTVDSSRALYLAAAASSELASLQEQSYQQISLSHPLDKTLPRKLEGMRNTLAAWRKTLDYGVREYATHANFRMGEAYLEMSQSLLLSERPAGLDELALEQYEILLEEQAYPLEEKAIAIHQANARRSWHGDYDDWVLASLQALADLLPARYAKFELQGDYSENIF